MFFVIDGSDGSGKATQVALLKERLLQEGRKVETIDFPKYSSNTFGALIRECLDGKRGDFMQIDPRIASALYAADRFESSGQIREWLEGDTVVIADRYVSANMLHQGAKLTDETERADFFILFDEMEHGVFGIPRPDLIMYLEVPFAVRKGLLAGDGSRKALDLAELDEAHQTATETAAQSLVAGLNNWQKIACTVEGVLRAREDIHEEIYRTVRQVLL